MLALANALGKSELEPELLNFRLFFLRSSIASETPSHRDMTSAAAENLQQMAETLFGGALAVTPETAAKALCCSRSHVYWLMKTGALDSIRLGYGKRAGQRVPVTALIEFIANGGTGKADCLPTPAARLAASRSHRGPAGKLL
jgi:hypothetical protein